MNLQFALLAAYFVLLAIYVAYSLLYELSPSYLLAVTLALVVLFAVSSTSGMVAIADVSGSCIAPTITGAVALMIISEMRRRSSLSSEKEH